MSILSQWRSGGRPTSGHRGGPVPPFRLTMVQFGNYAEAYDRLAQGGPESYYAEKYTVDFLSSLVARDDVQKVTVINLGIEAPPRDLANGVHTRGLMLYPAAARSRHRELLCVLAQTDPTHVVVMTPNIPVIGWAIMSGVALLPMFADSFRADGAVSASKHRILAWLLNRPSVAVVANHNLAASLELARIGVDAGKVVPFDWPALITPRAFAPKSAPPRAAPFRLIFVGAVIETKGVGDAIRAVGRLRRRGLDVSLTVVGGGEIETFGRLAEEEGVRDAVTFTGRKGHDEVVEAMRSHDAVVVPSHWSYPEGLPMTLYEALCTRTPLLASDHPMFKLKIKDGRNALVFPERDPDAFAARVAELMTSPQIYARLSLAGEEAADDYLCPLKYDSLISDFLDIRRRDHLRDYSLARSAAGSVLRPA